MKLFQHVKDRCILLVKPSALKLALVVMAFCLYCLTDHYRNGNDSGNSKLDWVGRLENTFYDIRFLLRGTRTPTGRVGVLDIDEKSIGRFGRWPFARSVYERPFHNLKARGVKWIGFDVVFTEPEQPLLKDTIPGIQSALEKAMSSGAFDLEKFEDGFAPLMENSLGDKSLAKGIGDFKNIVQGFFYFENGADNGLDYDWMNEFKKIENSKIDMVGLGKGATRQLSDFRELMSHGNLANIPLINAASEYVAFFNNEAQSSDGIVRSNVLAKALAPRDPKTNKLLTEPAFFPSLSLSLAANYLGRVIAVELSNDGISSVRLMDPNAKKEPIDIPLRNNGKGWMLINHYGPEGTLPHVSLADADENKLPAKLPEVLIMGGTATGINDVRPSPFSRSIGGVEHHVAAVENIITKRFMKRPESAIWIELGCLVASGLLLTYLLNKTSALRSLLVMIGLIFGVFVIDKLFLFGRGYWFYMGTMYFQSVAIYFSVTLFKYFTEEKEKKKVKNAFQHYLNPAVINQILDHPEKLKLGGEKRELTVFFSDVRGFTTISETLTPEALTVLLNEYFTPMTQIVLDSGGLLDKYIGDAIMAVWGAPLQMGDHADRAVASAVMMLDALDVLRAQWKERGMPLIDIGMGINTGQMTVGNMGSDQRFDYTVMGDAVNLASRLEGINKEYRTRTIISEMTHRRLKNPQRFLCRELDSIVVKGKTEPVRIYEVIRPSLQQQFAVADLIGEFEAGLAAYRAQKWDEAQRHFMAVMRINPNDGPTQVFLERCRYLSEHNPGEGWNGAWVMKTK